MTGHLTDFQYHTIHHHLFFTEFALCPVPQTLKPGHCETFSSNPLFYMFPPSLLASPLLLFFFFFHSLAQTALALTRGHPMLSLSNYLTNHSETALISAYCSAWLNAASLGGLSGKLWYGGPTGRQAEKGEQQPPCIQISKTPGDAYISRSSLLLAGVVQLVMALLNASLHLCSVQRGESYWTVNSRWADKKPHQRLNVYDAETKTGGDDWCRSAAEI